ncbi:YebC-like protein [Hypoxylon cercidicola]|nr:YebC-like protein [Hypoxylon cercidicola]
MSYLFFPTRSLALRPTTSTAICAQCCRSFSTNSILFSGHNRWSKIKHEKGAADAKKNIQRSTFAKHLTLYSKLYGSDPNLNPQLATVIAAAKKAGMPKASIDVAVARGQGKSSTGAGLESVTLEVMMSPSVAMVIDVETENKPRALQELRTMIKKHKGIVTPTAFLFTRLGRIILRDDGHEFDEVLMQALEAGAEDVEQDENDDIVIWTQPNTMHQAIQNLGKALPSAEILSSDIMWSPTADKTKLDDAVAATAISKLLTELQEYADVQGVYANAERGAISEDVWKEVEDNLDT